MRLSGAGGRALYAASNQLSMQGAHALGPAIARQCGLTMLDLSRNLLGDEGVRALLPHLARLAQLRTVGLRGCSMTRSCMLALRDALQLSDRMGVGGDAFDVRT
jgi:hypothetical protein